MGTGNGGGKIVANFHFGQKAYRLGWASPLWQAVRSVYQMTRKPYITGGSALLLGYLYACVMRAEIPISKELVDFQRRDQMRRLRLLIGLRSRPAH